MDENGALLLEKARKHDMNKQKTFRLHGSHGKSYLLMIASRVACENCTFQVPGVVRSIWEVRFMIRLSNCAQKVRQNIPASLTQKISKMAHTTEPLTLERGNFCEFYSTTMTI